MTGWYPLDTNMAGCVINGNIPAVRGRIVRVPMAQLAISTVTEGELRCGLARRTDATRLQVIVDEFLVRVTILPWDSKAARHYGEIRATLEREGRPMGSLDMMIAAHAQALEAVLVTNDRAFKRIKHLRVEDWTRR